MQEAKQAQQVLLNSGRKDLDIELILPEGMLFAVDCDVEKYDIVIMDIDFKNEQYNGIDLSRKINEKLPVSQIIYLTNYLEFAPEVYETRHCYFVLKANMELMLPRAVEKARLIVEETKEKEVLEVVCEGKATFIEEKAIQYIEKVQRTLQIHTQQKTYSCYLSLRTISKRLNALFVRCHGGYIVNLEHIQVVEKDSIQLDNQVEIPIGVTYEKEFRHQYLEYWSKRV